MTKSQNQQLAGWLFGSASFVFLIWSFIFGPNDLPAQKQLTLGLISAFAAGFLGYFITGTIGVDSANALASGAKFGIKAAGGAALFVLVLFWWQPNRSPVQQEDRTAKKDFPQTEHSASTTTLPTISGQDLITARIPSKDPSDETVGNNIIQKKSDTETEPIVHDAANPNPLPPQERTILAGTRVVVKKNAAASWREDD